MTKIPLDDILESLYRFKLRESDQVKTVLELYDMCEHNTFPDCMYRHKHFVLTSHMMLHAHAWLKLCFPSKVVSSSCHLSRAPCRLTRTARLLCCSPLCLHPPHLLFLAHAQRCFNQEPAPIHTALEVVTILRKPNLAQVVSPKWLATRRLSTSLTRWSLTQRVLTLPKITSTPPLKRVRFQKLRISSLYHKPSHYCLRPKILLKALPRLKKQTWTTNLFVLHWLHHGTCRSEKQVRNDHKFISLKEKV